QTAGRKRGDMNLLALQSFAQLSVERVVNSLPEGLLLAFFVWLLLRLIGRQNSGTRFAVWFVTLMAVVGLSVFGGFRLGEAHLLPITPHFNSHVTISTFWAELIFALWVLATAIALVRIAIGLWQIWAIRKSCTEIELSQLTPATANIFQNHSSTT